MMQPTVHNSTHQSGISLVEVMVALVLSLFLVAGVIQVYLGNKRQYNFTSALGRIQENGRLAMEMFSQDLRMADFWGCAARNTGGVVNNLLNTANAAYNPAYAAVTDGVTGTEGGAVGVPDSLTISGVFGTGFNLSTALAAVGNPIQVPAASGFSLDDILLISDCQNGDIFQVNGAAGNSQDITIVHLANVGVPGNTTANLSVTYDVDALVYRIDVITYSIIDPGLTGEPTLVRTVNGNNQELASGVEDLQILYGIDANTDGIADGYVNAAAGAFDAQNVVSIRVGLLLRSQSTGVVDEPQPIVFDGTALPAQQIADRRLRQVFSTTVGLRNRLL